MYKIINHINLLAIDSLIYQSKNPKLTFTAARHMSATMRPATLVSNICETEKLKTFWRATC